MDINQSKTWLHIIFLPFELLYQNWQKWKQCSVLNRSELFCMEDLFKFPLSTLPVCSYSLLRIHSQLESFHQFLTDQIQLISRDASDPAIHVQCLNPSQIIQQSVKLRTITHQFSSLIREVSLEVTQKSPLISEPMLGWTFLSRILNIAGRLPENSRDRRLWRYMNWNNYRNKIDRSTTSPLIDH